MANRQTLDRLLDAFETRLTRSPRSVPVADLTRFEQELEEVVQLAERNDAAYFRNRIDLILSCRRH